MTKGVSFYNNREECIAQFEKAPLSTKAVSAFKSCRASILHELQKPTLLAKQVKINPSYINPDFQSQSSKLVVCIHGLNNSPLHFKSLVDELGELDNTKIYTPEVKEGGNAKLDELVQPIFENIKKWAAEGQDKELVLVGISNGGRVARAIEVELAKSDCKNIKKIRFISIAGACKGSSLVDLSQKCHLTWLMSKNIAEEMPMSSERSKKLNAEWEELVNSKDTIPRDYTFIASPHDLLVPDYDSSLMEVSSRHKSQYAIISGHGHDSIVDAVAKSVAEIIKQKPD